MPCFNQPGYNVLIQFLTLSISGLLDGELVVAEKYRNIKIMSITIRDSGPIIKRGLLPQTPPVTNCSTRTEPDLGTRERG